MKKALLILLAVSLGFHAPWVWTYFTER